MKIKRVFGINAFCQTGTMDSVVSLFRDVLGAQIRPNEPGLAPDMPWLAQYGHRARVAYLGLEEPFFLEISESINDELPIGKQHKRSAPSFQGLGFEVENLDEAIAELRAKGIRVSDRQKIDDPAFDEMYECTIHPKDAFGLIIELIELKKSTPDG